MIGWPEKSPAGIADYWIDWGPTLELSNDNDSVTVSIWDTHADISVENEFILGDVVHIWISGGVDGKLYTFTNNIQTLNGRTFEAYFKIRVRAQACVIIDS